ncbi:MFS transporter [Prevotella sp.]|uniref:MFS transporter n=1 Tax=Prevotella sp. TaxID=59823 RepID=UPI002649AC9F|nr:MFS transporter [Prevotella sp.]MDN5553621.1 MFS transporter [Prevotella sp.]
MENNNTQHGNIIAIITMMFLFAMISFVTNLAAPIGVIWKNVFSGTGSENLIGMLGNAMNFLAYLFMGIPAGKLLTKIGYKKTALAGIATGFVGVLIQFISGRFGADISGFAIYLFGAFISGFAVCILNTVVNPMLNLLGGGGNRGNQLNLIGGTLNSLSGTLTPMLVGALIGSVTANTKMADINLVLFIALGVFAMAFIVLLFIPIADPEMGKTTSNTVFEHSPWAFRHFVLGTIAIFVYVGVEVGIPGTLNFYISDASAKGAGLVGNAAAVGGFVAGTYWLLMLVGRFIGSFIGGNVSSRTMMIGTTTLGMVLIIAAMILGKTTTVSMPVFTGSSFTLVTVPIAALLLVLCGLCTSIMWSSIFNLATEGLGKYSAAASGIFMMMVVGGGLLPLVQNFIADHSTYMVSYIVPLLAIAFMLYYALFGSKNVNKEIPID